ncbi:MAG TPA: hypothetical protein VFH73_13450 [Polyangia bacterium]|nr:hypothetical protein [Polyangia bacterium]
MIAFDRLAALALGELGGEALDEVELHVLSCTPCARILERLVLLGAATRDLVVTGKVRNVVGPALSARLTELGLVGRRFRIAPGQVVPCAVGTDDVYVLAEMTADLGGVERVDLLLGPAGAEQQRIQDVPFDAASGMVMMVDRGDLLRQMPSMRLQMTLCAVDGERQRVLGEYVLDHHAAPP